MEFLFGWLRRSKEEKQPKKTQKNKKFTRTPSIPSVDRAVGQKRKLSHTEFISPIPPRKKQVVTSPFSLHNTKASTSNKSPINKPTTVIPQFSFFSPLPLPSPQTMPKTKKELPVVIELSSDSESEVEDEDNLPFTDYEYQAQKAIELGRLQNEETLDFSPLHSEDDEEDDEEATSYSRSPDPYRVGFEELFAIPERQRVKFERLKAKKLERILKSKAVLDQKAEEYEQLKARKIADANRMRPLSSEEIDIVERIIYEGRDDQVIVDDITRKDLRTLNDGEWLNDVIINSYLALITKRSKENPERYAKCHHMTSYFYSTLTRTGTFDYSRVRRWTSKIDLFSMEKIMIPIHLGNHWTLVVIQVPKRHIDYYDSLGGTHRCVIDLKRYLKEEYKDKKKGDMTEEWTHTYHKNIPHQQNGYDCGVFALRFAECEARNSHFDFSQRNMRYFRQRMILEIVAKEIAM